MRGRAFKVLGTVSCVTLLGLAACTDNTVAPRAAVTRSPQQSGRIAAAMPDLHPYEAGAREIGAAVPSFAGMSIDTLTGDAVAFITDLRDSIQAKDRVSLATVDVRPMRIGNSIAVHGE